MYKIRLDHFEGPLDLLLFFIKRDELNIYDIPISRITKEFLDYVRIIQMLDLEVAGDFILMASTLMHIKVRMLLPREVDEKGVEIDPRAELVARLLEYKRYKEMSEDLSFLESSQRKVMYRAYFEGDEKQAPPELETVLKNVSLYDLAKMFKRVMDNMKPPVVHEIKKVPVSIDDQIAFILAKLENGEVHFMALVQGMTEKIRIVVTFIALLELTKMGSIGIRETPTINDFIIYRLAGGDIIQFSD